MNETPQIKVIVFDLDGVLVDSRELHYEALNRALHKINPNYPISREDHLAKYDGHPTTYKLNLLTAEKGVPKEIHSFIWELKQKLTLDVINDTYKEDERVVKILKELKNKGFKLFCATNSIYTTVKQMLVKKGFIDYFDYFISNEEVRHPKPSPEIYLQCCIRANVGPKEVLILEDSPVGRKAALSSGCHLLPIIDPDDVTLDKILNAVSTINSKQSSEVVHTEVKWQQKLNVVIPMVDFSKTFEQQGYAYPKFLTDILGKPLLQIVTENLNLENAKFVFVVNKTEYETYNLQLVFNLLTPNCKVVTVDGPTNGALCTVLLAKAEINVDEPLLIANCGQYLEWDSNQFLYAIGKEVDGGLVVFNNTHPRYSYAKVDTSGWVTEVQEKKPISNVATAGIYYWSKGSEFVKYAEQLISKGEKVDGKYYVCPVYNQAIADGKKFKVHYCKKMWPLSLPEDINQFSSHHQKSV